MRVNGDALTGVAQKQGGRLVGAKRVVSKGASPKSSGLAQRRDIPPPPGAT